MRFSADLLFAKVLHLLHTSVDAMDTLKSGPIAATGEDYQISVSISSEIDLGGYAR
jgi:hypothetical protein